MRWHLAIGLAVVVVEVTYQGLEGLEGSDVGRGSMREECGDVRRRAVVWLTGGGTSCCLLEDSW